MVTSLVSGKEVKAEATLQATQTSREAGPGGERPRGAAAGPVAVAPGNSLRSSPMYLFETASLLFFLSRLFVLFIE